MVNDFGFVEICVWYIAKYVFQLERFKLDDNNVNQICHCLCLCWNICLLKGKMCLSSLPTLSLSLRQQCNKFSNAEAQGPSLGLKSSQKKVDQTTRFDLLLKFGRWEKYSRLISPNTKTRENQGLNVELLNIVAAFKIFPSKCCTCT